MRRQNKNSALTSTLFPCRESNVGSCLQGGLELITVENLLDEDLERSHGFSHGGDRDPLDLTGLARPNGVRVGVDEVAGSHPAHHDANNTGPPGLPYKAVHSIDCKKRRTGT